MAESNMATSPAVTCTRCKKPQTIAQELKYCDCCQTAYCSTDCLKADRKKHQKYCQRRAEAASNPPPDGPGHGSTSTSSNHPSSGSGDSNNDVNALEGPSDEPFTRLLSGTYLHDRPRRDVFRLLLDCYRLRVDDNVKLDGIAPPNNLHDGFRQFLDAAAQRPTLLPPWWDSMAAEECKAFGTRDGAGWYSLERRVSKAEVNAHYDSPVMAMQL